MSVIDAAGILAVLVLAASIWAAERLGRGFAYPVRRLAAFGRLRRAVQDAVEGGKRMHLGLGHGALTQSEAGASLQGLAFQAELARQISTSDDPPTASAGDAPLAWMSAATFAAVYHRLGAPDYFSSSSAVFAGGTPLATMAGVLPQTLDRQTQGTVLGGHWGSEAALVFGLSGMAERISLAGSDDLGGQAVFFAASPAALLGDEWFASAEYLRYEETAGGDGRGAIHPAGLISMDIVRWVFCAVVLSGVIARLAGLI